MVRAGSLHRRAHSAVFQRRFTDMDWLIATPNGSARWDGRVLQTSREAAVKPDLTDETDELWRTYYANIFNPTRLKIKAMTAEMPKKYWKNLPEADLIPGLVLGAEARVLEMAAKAASQPQPFHHRLQAAASAREEPQPVPDGTLASLAREAGQCTRCALHCKATQAVFGQGPENAKVMIVGEQPGDHEDLAGQPFVGPAGQLFNRTLAETGIDRKSFMSPMPSNTSNMRPAANGAFTSGRMRAKCSNVAGGLTRKLRWCDRSSSLPWAPRRFTR